MRLTYLLNVASAEIAVARVLVARVLVAGMLVAGIGPAMAEEKVAPKVTYDDHVKPLLQQKCFSCHNPDKKSSDLDLTTYTNLMLGGASGTVIEPGDAAASYLFQLVTHESEPAMPPETPKIAEEMIETLRKWIDDGVLENSGSTAKSGQKKKFDLGLSAPSTERPEIVPMPARMSLQPELSPAARTATDALATSPWAPLAAVSGQHQVLLYRTDTLELIGVLPFPEGNPRVLKFSRNGGLLLAGGGIAGASGQVVVWDVRSGERIIELGDELDEVHAADISSDQTLIALAGPQRVVRIYATETGRLMHEIRKHTDWVTSLEFSPDSVLLATGDRNGGLFVWEAWTGREYLTLNGHTASVTSVSWRSDSNLLASASEDSTIRLWEMENGGQVKNWGAHGGGATSVEFTRDGRLFSCGRDRVAKLWDQSGGQQVAYEAFADLALEATFCDETERAVSGDWSGEIRVWNAADGNRLGELAMNPPTLESRLALANLRLVEIQQLHAPIDETRRVAVAALEQLRATLTVAQQASAEAKQGADAAATSLASAQQFAAQATTQRNEVQKRVDDLASTVPVLREASVKASDAASRLPDNENLVAAARTIQSTAEAKSSELDSARQALEQKTKEAEQAAMEIGGLEQAAQKAAALLAAAQNAEQEQMAKLPSAQETADASTKAFDQSVAELTSAQQAVAHWIDEIAFDKVLDDLFAQRSALSNVLSEQEQALSTLQQASDSAASELLLTQQAVSTIESMLASAENEYRAAVVAVDAARKAEQEAIAAADAASTSVRQQGQVIDKLAEAIQTMEQAKAIEEDDSSLDPAINGLKQLVAQKGESLEVIKAELAAMMMTKEVAATQVQATQQNVTNVAASIDSIKGQLAEKIAEMPGLESANQAAQSILDSVSGELEQKRQQLESIGASIATAKGLAL